MNDITKATDPLSQNAISVLRDIDRMRSELAHLRQENQRLDVDLAIARNDVQTLHNLLDKTEHERAFYQRYCTELVTELSTVGDLVSGVMKRARDGAYRPNGAPPPIPATANGDQQQTDEGALPAVVTKGPDNDR